MEPTELQKEASAQLRYIRDTMARSSAFTDIPGWGIFIVGLIALVASWLTSGFRPAFWTVSWKDTWMLTAIVSAAVGVTMLVRKAKAAQHPVTHGPIRKFALGMLPAIVAAMVLTSAFTHRTGLDAYLSGQMLPADPMAAHLHALWLLLYGVAIVSSGMHSIRVVPLMGLCFMALGVVAFAFPDLPKTAMMTIGFGGLHLIFGYLIAKKYGG